MRRSPGAYPPARRAGVRPAARRDGLALPELVTFDRISDAHPAAIAGTLRSDAVAHHDGQSAEDALAAHNAASMTALALKAGHASLEAHLAGTAVDAGGLLPDLQTRTRGPRRSTRSTRWSCSRCSSATRPRRSS